jgi:hypothetical protein
VCVFLPTLSIYRAVPRRATPLHTISNETMDAAYLCEFHQVEGVVLDYTT